MNECRGSRFRSPPVLRPSDTILGLSSSSVLDSVRVERGRSQAGLTRKAVVGFFVSGMLVSLLGALLPAWRLHLREDFITIGNYFLSLNAGMLAAISLSRQFLPKSDLRRLLVTACAVPCASLLYLAALPPGAADWWRSIGLFGIGCGAGLLNAGLFQAITPAYRENPVATLYLSGTLFGFGCIVTALLVAGTFYVYAVPNILILLAAVPGFATCIYGRSKIKIQGARTQPSVRQALSDFRSAAAVLLALLLFFQFGNEWALAGWMPLYLIRRIGVSPEVSLVLLALYWLALLMGRVVVLRILPAVNHGKLLGGSLLAALFGLAILTITNNRFGAVIGILFVGGGFASVYPLVAEKIGARFPYYHPGLFNGIFSLAMTGGMLAPWSLGFMTAWWGIRAVMIVPLLGSFLVFLLLVAIWAEAKFSESAKPLA